MKKDYHLILGVPSNAPVEVIKKAYRKLALIYHPDRNPQGAEKFREIMEAYQFLINPQNQLVPKAPERPVYKSQPQPPRKPEIYQVQVDEVDLIVNKKVGVRVDSHNLRIGKKMQSFNLFGVTHGTKRQYSVELYPVERVELHFKLVPNKPWKIDGFDLIGTMSISWSNLFGKPLIKALPDGITYSERFPWKTLEWIIPKRGTYQTRYKRGDVKLRISLTFGQKIVYTIFSKFF